MTTAQTAKTQYIDATNGVKFTYRRISRSAGVPLVMHIHFRGSMDFWDPALLNALGAARPVIIFDQVGVGRSTGEIPTTFKEWADNLIVFTIALSIAEIDLLGFSMGGAAAQVVALTAPKLIRRLILAATSTSVPDNTVTYVPGIVWPCETALPKLSKHSQRRLLPSPVLLIHPSPNDTISHEAAKAYWNRIQERNVAGEPRMFQLPQ